MTCVTQLLFNGHPESQLQLNYISVSCITIIITPKLTSEQQEGSLSDCVSAFPMKMSASPPVLIILEVAISRRRLEATNQAKWQFRVGHGAHGGRGQMGTRSGTGKPMTTHYRSFSKTNLESTLSALLFVTGWRGCNGKSFSWGSKYFSRYSVTSIWCTAIYIFAKNLKPPCNLPISSPST